MTCVRLSILLIVFFINLIAHFVAADLFFYANLSGETGCSSTPVSLLFYPSPSFYSFLLQQPCRDKGSAKTCFEASCDGGFQTLLVLMILSAEQQIKRVTRVAGEGCHSILVAAAGWFESGSVCRCVRPAEIEEAPVAGGWGPLALPMLRQ